MKSWSAQPHYTEKASRKQELVVLQGLFDAISRLIPNRPYWLPLDFLEFAYWRDDPDQGLSVKPPVDPWHRECVYGFMERMCQRGCQCDKETSFFASPHPSLRKFWIVERRSLSLVSLPLKPVSLSYRERFAILKRDEYRCRLCNASAKDGDHVRLEVDHITPRAHGGTNDPTNLWTLCFACNRGKGVQPL